MVIFCEKSGLCNAFMDKDRTLRILEMLKAHYGDLATALEYKTPFELLVATMLSAQCTDVQVNKVTGKLFLKYDTPFDFANIELPELESHIKSCGFYKVKSRNIIETSKILIERYAGRVPQSLESLVKLPGVGRKTANVVLSNAFGIDAIAVDTHVFRVSKRLGMSYAATAGGTEAALMEAIPKNLWSKSHNWLIWHGRRICTAKKPKCGECFLRELCDYALAIDEETMDTQGGNR
jgi:endonuclease-3